MLKRILPVKRNESIKVKWRRSVYPSWRPERDCSLMWRFDWHFTHW